MPGSGSVTGRVKGFALVTVLWVAVLLGLFVAGTLDAVDRGSRETRGAAARFAAEAMVEAGLARAVWVLKTSGVSRERAAPLRADGLVWRDTFEGGAVAMQIVPADSLVDLNAASDVVLTDFATFLSWTAARPEDRESVVSALQEARGRHLSVQSFYSIEFDPPFTADQLAVARNMTTVGSGRLAPVLATAPAYLLRDVVGVEDEVLEDLLALRRAQGPQPLDPYAYPDSDAQPVTPPRGPVWHIRVAARSSPNVAVGRTWVIFLPLPEMRAEAPYFVLESWPLSLEDSLVASLDARPENEEKAE